jgi:hypothetical protein
MPEGGLEPPRDKVPADFESAAYANFATPAAFEPRQFTKTIAKSYWSYRLFVAYGDCFPCPSRYLEYVCSARQKYGFRKQHRCSGRGKFHRLLVFTSKVHESNEHLHGLFLGLCVKAITIGRKKV